MSHLMEYYRRVRRWHPELNSDVGIVLSRHGCTSPEKGMALADLREAYKEHTEWDFPIKGSIVMQLNFLMTVPYVACYCNSRGTLFFYLVEPCKIA